MSAASAGARLRAALAQERPLQVVGAINAYSALLAQRSGFRAIYLSGAGVANASFGLPDLGYIRASLAVVRWPTWMPAVLSETMFFMMPEQEAALRDPAVIQRIAQAHLRALEEFLKSSTR